ncbi:diguanylate cyclase [Pseudidiomarina terrestris]|uniref:diguanylate cyclase n=1 Tax=Pseudidiomarina terrestris TaxID=2820060 RepID=A0AAW7R2X4_9GAMM|nr:MULTISPECIES: diguanylate cyclase [unclassified Pseudidiomarina]MDN7125463.1 diguanylate cyclase [Pseudidiomarina sp. 1APP75-32.1]MDN7128106.1 diguanylate cyclase [Pseudidiomarina sp. 1APR75-33.1]MDN7130221.1 diguanylate cyclase [Pseudidiomarina sp. 1APR75-15]MDN7135730.1 diguanylate cyclase [Pseudidiomarina sp. 1ASP75-5]MDN7137233.1 diguanylate cyclase [Pseudidiomarina sp. 1ASP75-14]
MEYSFWRHISLRAQTLAAFLVPIILVAGLSWIVSVTMENVRQLSDRSDRLVQEISVRNRMLQEVINAETGERGFIITGDEQFLEPFERAQSKFAGLASQWRSLSTAADDKAQLMQMEQLFQRWLNEIAKPAITARAKQPMADNGAELESVSQALVASGRGKQLVDDMREIIRSTIAEKQTVLSGVNAELIDRMRLVERMAVLLPVIGVGLGLAILLLMQMGVISSIDRLRKTARDVEKGDLSARVHDNRSDELGILARDFNRMVDQLELAQRESTVLAGFQSMLVSSNDEDEAYGAAARALSKLFPELSGALYLIAPSRDFAELATSWGFAEKPTARFHPEDCRALRLGRTYVATEESAEIFCAHAASKHPQFTLCIPLVTRDEVMGTLFLAHVSNGDDGMSKHQIALAQTVAERLSLALSNLRLTERLRRESVRDPLTGLFNRRYLEETLEREIQRVARAGKPLSIITLDVDHFKRFNDSFGHEAGDRVLEELATVMTALSRPGDVACRFGGEEFMLILPEVGVELASVRAEDMRRRIESLQLSYGGTSLGTVTISLGVATYPVHTLKKEELIRFADNALYEAKNAGRNQIAVYSKDGSS